VRPTLFAGVTSTRANPANAVGLKPPVFLDVTMSKVTGELVSVKIIPNEQGTPAGKLADSEVIFEGEAGPLSGLKLIGFAMGERNVTFPTRPFIRTGRAGASRCCVRIWGFQHVAGFRRRHVGASIQEAWTTSLDNVRATLDADSRSRPDRDPARCDPRSSAQRARRLSRRL
jgi:hypothetical protein